MNNEKHLRPSADLLTALILLSGCALRLIGLASSSLTLNEAENALAALKLFSGGDQGQLLYTLPTALLFKMFGDSDFTARLSPAFAGMILMLLPLTLLALWFTEVNGIKTCALVRTLLPLLPSLL